MMIVDIPQFFSLLLEEYMSLPFFLDKVTYMTCIVLDVTPGLQSWGRQKSAAAKTRQKLDLKLEFSARSE